MHTPPRRRLGLVLSVFLSTAGVTSALGLASPAVAETPAAYQLVDLAPGFADRGCRINANTSGDLGIDCGTTPERNGPARAYSLVGGRLHQFDLSFAPPADAQAPQTPTFDWVSPISERGWRHLVAHHPYPAPEFVLYDQRATWDHHGRRTTSGWTTWNPDRYWREVPPRHGVTLAGCSVHEEVVYYPQTTIGCPSWRDSFDLIDPSTGGPYPSRCELAASGHIACPSGSKDAGYGTVLYLPSGSTHPMNCATTSDPRPCSPDLISPNGVYVLGRPHTDPDDQDFRPQNKLMMRWGNARDVTLPAQPVALSNRGDVLMSNAILRADGLVHLNPTTVSGLDDGWGLGCVKADAKERLLCVATRAGASDKLVRLDPVPTPSSVSRRTWAAVQVG